MIEVHADELIPGDLIFLHNDQVPVTFLAFDPAKGTLNFEYGDGEEDWVLADDLILVDRM